MKLENIKFSLQTTKNPLYFQLSFPLSETKATEAKLSHGGRAFTVLSKSEVKALCGKGYKPFALANAEVDLREQDNQDPTRPTLIKFDLLSAEFRGGMGDWDDILEAPPAPEKSADKPKGF